MAKDERTTEFRLIGTRPNRPDGCGSCRGFRSGRGWWYELRGQVG